MTVLAQICYALLCAIGIVGCGTPDPAPTPSVAWTATTIEVGGQTLSVLAPDGAPRVHPTEVTPSWCALPVWSTEIDRDGPDIEFTMLPSDCPPPSTVQYGNGYRGYFRSVDDVKNPTSVTEVATPIGTASIVAYSYYECTNSCTTATIETAIIRLDHPADPGHPSLQVREGLSITNGDEADVDLATYVARITQG